MRIEICALRATRNRALDTRINLASSTPRVARKSFWLEMISTKIPIWIILYRFKDSPSTTKSLSTTARQPTTRSTSRMWLLIPSMTSTRRRKVDRWPIWEMTRKRSRAKQSTGKFTPGPSEKNVNYSSGLDFKLKSSQQSFT